MSSRPRGSRAGVDLAAVPRSIWISAAGALVLLISVFLRWYSVTVKGFGGFSVTATASGWHATDISKLVALLAVAALAAWAVEVFWPATRLPYTAWAIAGAAGALAAILVVFRIVDTPATGIPDGGGISVHTAYGIWVALLSAVAVVAGAYLRMTEASSERV